MSFSKPLDRESAYVEPEWRIGSQRRAVLNEKELGKMLRIEMMQESAEEYDRNRRETADRNLGECLLDLEAFTHVALVWLREVNRTIPLRDVLEAKDPDVDRLNAIQNLTNTVMLTARDIPVMMSGGINVPVIMAWRLLAEAKNDAMFIWTDGTGEAARLWNLFHAANLPKADPDNQMYKELSETAKKQLAEEFGKMPNLSSKRWAKKPNGKKCSNNMDVCNFVWKNRKSTAPLTEDEKEEMAQREKQMLTHANSLIHPTAYHSGVKINLYAYLGSTLFSTMETAAVYKNAANFLMGIPEEVKQHDFTTYPGHMRKARKLSEMVTEMYEQALSAIEERFAKPLEPYRDPAPTLRRMPD